MLQHKNHRLNKRREFAYKTVSPEKTSPVSRLDSRKESRVEDNHSEISDFQVEEFSFVERKEKKKDQDGDEGKGLLNRTKYYFKLLKRTLVKWAALAYIYRIDRDNIF